MSRIDLLPEARALDAADALAHFRQQFHFPKREDGKPTTYLCGHSLGLAPRAARDRVNEELDDWARMAVNGHHLARRPWIEFADHLQAGLARLVGADPCEVVAMNSLSVNLHLMMATFYRPLGRRRLIVIEAGAFSSDRHAVVSQIEWHGLKAEDALIEISPMPGTDLVDEAQLESLLAERGKEIALVLWPGVQYRTGQAFDLQRIAGASLRAGAHCGFDLAHAIGNLPLALHDSAVDFAAWCSYKYLNGGPGAVAGAFVHSRHHASGLPRLAGWWGHDPATRFRMEPEFIPAKGAAGWQISNPPILSAAPLLESLRQFDAAGLVALRAKSNALSAFLLRELDARFTGQLDCVTPRDEARRGCQLSLRVRAGREAGRKLFEHLVSEGIVADWREPDFLRVAFAPLYNRYEDIARLIEGLDQALRVRA
jgi:kynureninase